MAGGVVRPFRSIGLSMVRNEQDIIEPFVRHNLGFLDFLVVVDNKSLDSTRDILVSLAHETGRLAVWDKSDFGCSQSVLMTNLLHRVQSVFFADFIMFFDADEFIAAPSREAFSEQLEAIPSYKVGKIPWKTYVLPKHADLKAMAEDPPRSMTWIRRKEGEQHYKAILRLDGRLLPTYSVSPGNHRLFDGADKDNPFSSDKEVPFVGLSNCHMLHFPVRSEAQITSKSVNGWMSIEAKRQTGAHMGRNEAHHWKENFDRAVNGQIGGILPEASMNYSQAPRAIDWDADCLEERHNIKYERRYSDGSCASPVALITKSWHVSVVPDKPLIGEDLQVRLADEGGDDAVDLPLLRYLRSASQAESLFEIGCGLGLNVVALARLGVKSVLGIDSLIETDVILPTRAYKRFDLAQFKGVKTKRDLALALDMSRSFREKREKQLVSALAASTAKLIAYLPPLTSIQAEKERQSAMDTCIKFWQKAGWSPDLAATLAARSVASFPGLRRFLLVLRPSNQVNLTEPDIKFLRWNCGLPHKLEPLGTRLVESLTEGDIQHYLSGHRR